MVLRGFLRRPRPRNVLKPRSFVGSETLNPHVKADSAGFLSIVVFSQENQHVYVGLTSRVMLYWWHGATAEGYGYGVRVPGCMGTGTGVHGYGYQGTWVPRTPYPVPVPRTRTPPHPI